MLRYLYVILWAAPLRTIVPFLVVALYSAPETDDFCFSSHNAWTALASVHQYYTTVTGRLPALTLMAMPSVISNLLGVDLFVIYPLANLVAILVFMAAMIAVGLMVVRDHWSLGVLFGLLICAALFAMLPSARQFLYWFTGVACYTVPTAGASLLAAWSTKKFAHREFIGRSEAILIGIVCLISSMCNEFTAFFLAGVVATSAAFRLAYMGKKEAQINAHAMLAAAILIGFMVIVFAPGNAVRMGQIPGSGDVGASLRNTFTYVPQYVMFLVLAPAVWCLALSALALGGASGAASDQRSTLLFLTALGGVTTVWVFSSYFIGAYGTGEVLALRARNEVWAVVLVVASIILVVASQATFLRIIPPAIKAGLVVVAACSAFGFDRAPARARLTAEWPQFSEFWRETMARNILLSTAKSNDVVVPRRTVTPSTLMEEELKETPDRLPNDCVARYYEKNAVVLAPASR
jgi:hypothetical protein